MSNKKRQVAGAELALGFLSCNEHVGSASLPNPSLLEGTRCPHAGNFARDAVHRSRARPSKFKNAEGNFVVVAWCAGASRVFDLSEHAQVGQGFGTGPEQRAVLETAPALADTIVKAASGP